MLPSCRCREAGTVRAVPTFVLASASPARLATLRDLKIADDDPRVNPNGGAIALGHPLGMSGARITGSAMLELKPGEKSLSTMCIGVGQGIAIALERV